MSRPRPWRQVAHVRRTAVAATRLVAARLRHASPRTVPATDPATDPGTAPGQDRAARPVLHHASGRRLDPRTPVVVGVGQVVQRDPSPPWREPADLALEALRRAADDSAAPDAAGLLGSADLVCAVASASWTHRDLGAEVARRLGAAPAATVQTARFGGDGGQLAVNEAARAVAAGEAAVALVLGAESGATRAAAQRAGGETAWTEQDAGVAPTRILGSDREPSTALEGAVGLGAPVCAYALVESALRARSGATPAEHRERIAGLWSRLSEGGADNQHAWLPRAFAGEELATPGPGDRPISSPCSTLSCAHLQVDLAAGLVVTSVAAAEAAGVPQERWVFPHAGAAATDEGSLSERGDLTASPALRAAGRAVLDHAGLTIDDVALVDLDSCFPAAVQVAAHELGLPLEDRDRPLTITGGLTVAGGPGNAYGCHAVATMVPRLREDPDAVGLTTSLGWCLTEHAVGLFSARPPERPYAALAPWVAPAPRRPATGSWEGPAVVEACTVPYDRAGEPEAAIVAAVTPDGTRGLARVTDPATVRRLDAGDPLGWTVALEDGALVVLEEGRADVAPPPPMPVLVEDHGPVRVITLNRPHRRNAVDLATAELLERVVDGFEADASARVAVLTGAGGAFSAGMDLKAAAAGQWPLTDRRGPLGLTALPLRKPLIAAVEGPALAGGCELALMADLVVASRTSIFGLPEPKRGLVAAAGGVLRLAQRLPRAVALEMALTADPLPAERLHALGLVNLLTEPGGTLAAALDLARRIVANAPVSVEVSREIVLAGPGWPEEEAFDRQSDLAMRALATQDATEGVLAFAEGRDPVWQGR